MKKVTLILIVMLLPIASACTSSQDDTCYIFYSEGDVRIFDIDYLEKYEDTLNAMFDYEWTLLTVEEKYIPIEEVHMRHMIRSFHPPIIRPEQFTEWTIEYRDGNEGVRRFIFDNRSDFSHQIAQYAANYIAEYYREKFFDNYIIGASSVHFMGMILSSGPVPVFHNHDNYVIEELDYATREHRRRLVTPEGAIRLSSLTPANVFEMLPFYLSISIHFDEHTGLNQQSIEENVLEQLENINHFTNHRLNAKVNITCFTDESGRHYGFWYYAQGERMFDLVDSVDFVIYIFESYRGMFWQ